METTNNNTLLFVYNANTGLKNGLLDILHKTFSPQTYSCQLCQITYGSFAIKKRWKSFLQEASFQTQFLHKDEFLRNYPHQQIKLPCVLLKENDQFYSFISSDELNQMDLETLMETIQQKDI
jgi:hypothetical protein